MFPAGDGENNHGQDKRRIQDDGPPRQPDGQCEVSQKPLFNEDVELARESDFANMFPDCEIGAMPPFGNLYGVDEIISEDLTRDPEIVFNAGSHTELIKMRYKDFEKLVRPKIVNFRIQI
jgi:Ala-tRNA(Pro) deacylase